MAVLRGGCQAIVRARLAMRLDLAQERAEGVSISFSSIPLSSSGWFRGSELRPDAGQLAHVLPVVTPKKPARAAGLPGRNAHPMALRRECRPPVACPFREASCGAGGASLPCACRVAPHAPARRAVERHRFFARHQTGFAVAPLPWRACQSTRGSLRRTALQRAPRWPLFGESAGWPFAPLRHWPTPAPPQRTNPSGCL